MVPKFSIGRKINKTLAGLTRTILDAGLARLGKDEEEDIPMKLSVGQLAPDFILESHLGNKVHLSDFRGKCNVVLAFFPLAWTPI